MRWQLVDKILECDAGKSAVGVKTFSPDDEIFLDHFPGYPRVPGVLLIEMMATVSGFALRATDPNLAIIFCMIKGAKFSRFVKPGEPCTIRSRVESYVGSLAIFDASVEVDGVTAASAKIVSTTDGIRVENDPLDRLTADWLKK